MSGIHIVVGPRVRVYLEGGALFQEPDRLDIHGYGSAGRQLVLAVNERPASKQVSLLRAQAVVLAELTEFMLYSSRDDASWSADAKADVAAARRLLAALAKQEIYP